jgi:RHS repeat-associated protein
LFNHAGYDNANRRTSATYPNGVVATYSYDAASELTGIVYTQGATTVGTLTYSYDLAGHRVAQGGTLFQSVLPAAVTSATYDANNRLTLWTTPSGSVSPTYDNNGNLTNDGSQVYVWDARNRLAGITSVAAFAYDPVGRRQSITQSGTTTTFLNDGSTPVQESSGGTVTANLLLGTSIDDRITRTAGGATATYLTNALGSTVALTDSTGAIQTSYGYDPYGNTSITGTATTSNYAYAGRENDGTGLYYNRARYYNPTWGRFISEDPIGFDGGINFYEYADGNPIQFRDPSGLCLPCLAEGAVLLYDLFEGGSAAYEGAAAVEAASGAATAAEGVSASEMATTTAVGALGMGVCLAGACAHSATGTASPASGSIKPSPPPPPGTPWGENSMAASSNELGDAGESAVRGSYDIGPKKTIDIGGRNIVPDGITPSTLSEVKNVGYHAYTLQLRGYFAYANATGRIFYLYLRPGATLAGPLQAAIEAGDIIPIDIPF